MTLRGRLGLTKTSWPNHFNVVHFVLTRFKFHCPLPMLLGASSPGKDAKTLPTSSVRFPTSWIRVKDPFLSARQLANWVKSITGHEVSTFSMGMPSVFTGTAFDTTCEVLSWSSMICSDKWIWTCSPNLDQGKTDLGTGGECELRTHENP